MDLETKKIYLSIKSLESQLASKKDQLRVIRENCNHVWEEHKGVEEDGTIFFAEKVCAVCGETKTSDDA
jgi:hypothetical protein